MSHWLVNGTRAASIPMDDRGFQYGDGLFETIAVRDGSPRFLDLHLARMTSGLQRLGIAFDQIAPLRAEIESVAMECAYGTAKAIVTRGSGPRGYRPPTTPDPRRLVGIFAAQPAARANYEHGVAVRMCETTCGSNARTGGIKTLNRLEQVLARAEWSDPGIAEGLMLDAQGRLVCGTMTNCFLVRDDRLSTPSVALSGIAGIMRGVVIDAADAIGLKPEESDIYPSELRAQDELFVTNSQIGIWPVRRCQDLEFGPGRWTHELMARLADLGVAECAL